MTYQHEPLGDLASLQAGYGFPVELQGRTSGDYPFAKVGDISRCGRSTSTVLEHADHYVDADDLVALRAKPIPAGSVLFAKIGEAIRQNHRVIAGCDMLIDNNAMAAVPSTKIDGRFLYHFLKTVDFYRLAPATTVPALRKSDLEKLPTPCPPLPEQRRIAAILDKADALRTKRREALAQLDRLAQSIFVEMFGDPGSNPMMWPEIKLGDLIVGKPNNGIFKKNEEYGDGLPVAWVEELFRGDSIDVGESRRLQASTKEVEQYGLKNGDILFCRSSLKLAGIGYNNVYLGEDNAALFECHVIRLSPNRMKVSPVFLNFALRMENQRKKLFKFAKTVTMSTIDQDGLKQIPVPIPPLDQQHLFSERLKSIGAIRLQNAAALKQIGELFDSLQHRAFRGEL